MNQEKHFEERKVSTMHFMQLWQRHQKLTAFNAEEANEGETDALDNTTSVEPTNYAPFDTDLASGQIRLLSQPERITYVALLRRWEDDSFVVMPFSHFSAPATDEEFKLENDRGHFARVLQAWNTRTLQDNTLKKSWLVDNLTEEEAQQAWDLWCSTITGNELSDKILQRTGLPIYRDDDPRLEYKREECANFDQLDAEDLAELEQQPKWPIIFQPLPAPRGDIAASAAFAWSSNQRLAAGAAKPNPQYEYVTEVADQKLTVAFEYSQHERKLNIRVYDERGEISKLLDNYQVWSIQSDQSLGTIQEGKLKVEYNWEEGNAIQIVSTDGEPLPGTLNILE